jgi:hypothetical protein
MAVDCRAALRLAMTVLADGDEKPASRLTMQ